MTASLELHLEGADPIQSAKLWVDRSAEPEDIVRMAFKQRQLDGREPYAARVVIDAPAEPETLLPPDATIVRRACDENTTTVLARTPIGSVLLTTFPRSTAVSVASASRAHASSLVEGIKARAPQATPSDMVPVRTWYSHGGLIQSESRDISAPAWTDIADNYPASTRAHLDALTNVTEPRDVGKLILWHGPPGTGKTTALRALMRAWAPWCDAQYIADPEMFFGLPAYITQVISGTDNTPFRRAVVARSEPRWRLVIAEDCDEYLRASARRDAGAALGRLLNLADGVLGQGYDTLILLTTNEDLHRLHPALTRPGRCLAEVAFPTFSRHEAGQWLPDDIAVPDEPVSLAELYALRHNPTAIREPAERVTTGQYL